MRIVIAGCGKIGQSMIHSLVSEGHEIVVIDSDREVIDCITTNYDVMGICSQATSCKALTEANIGSAELFIAAADSDDINMLSCFLAKRMGAKHTVARIRSGEYTSIDLDFMKKQLELSMVINPERLTAKAIYDILKFPSAVKCESFTRSRFEMAEMFVKPGSVLDGASLSDLRSRSGASFLVCAVLRGKSAHIPRGMFILRGGDRIGLIAAPEDMQKLLNNLGILQKRAKHVFLLGASRIAGYLSEELIRSGNSVKIIEKDENRCDEISAMLGAGAVVIHGDGAQHEVLDEEGLASADAFVALTGMDEENLLISYYALDHGVPKVIAKLNQEAYHELGEQLGVECTVSPKRITADVILQYARALQSSMGSRVETLYSLMNGTVEALEFAVSSDFEYTNIPLKDLKIKPDILLAGIIRGSKNIIPGGEDIIKPDDKVIIIAAGRKLCDLSDVIEQ